MGITTVTLKVSKPADPTAYAVVKDVIVDTSASLTWLPKDKLRRIGIKETEEEDEWKTFISITGSEITRKTGAAVCEVNGTRGACAVVFAETGDKYVMGVDALENMGLEVDPVTKTVRKKPGLLAV